MVVAPSFVAQAARRAAANVQTLPDLGDELSRQLHRLLPHDGYMLSGLDPVTGAGCFRIERDGYSCDHFRRIKDSGLLDRHPYPPRRPHDRRTSVTVLDRKATVTPGGTPLLGSSMVAEGWGSEMRLELVNRGVHWGTLVLLREGGRPPFAPVDVDAAQQIVAPLAASLRRYIARATPHPLRGAMPPGVLVIDENGAIASASPTGRDWLRVCFPYLVLDTDEDLSLTVWNFVAATRHMSDPVFTCVPTGRGWIALQAQQLTGARRSEVAITLQAATTSQLLPAVSAWYSITPRERTVIEQVLEGRSGKQIARSLELSQYTTNDHLKAVYRKIHVSGRDELIATLSS